MTFYPFPRVSPMSASMLRRDLGRIFDEVLPFGPLTVALSDSSPTAAGESGKAADEADGASSGDMTQWAPRTEARETPTSWVFDLDLPGVAPESVSVLATEGILTVEGSRVARELAEGEKALFSERKTGGFRRRFRLPANADLQKVTASYALGVLTVSVAKPEPPQTRRVPVSVSTAHPA